MTKTEPKDVFLHLLAIIALYASAVAFLVMLFQYINVLIPDPLQRGYYQLQIAIDAFYKFVLIYSYLNFCSFS